MSVNAKTVKIYMMPLEFPCGPNSACCGPIGQSDEVIQGLKGTIEKELNLGVEVINVRQKMKMSDVQVVRLLNTFGPMALPLIALDGDVVSMGNPSPEEAVQAIRQKLTG
ncbi:MAG: hypothetical protein AB1478_06155 [Nitrospirota bacterium]